MSPNDKTDPRPLPVTYADDSSGSQTGDETAREITRPLPFPSGDQDPVPFQIVKEEKTDERAVRGSDTPTGKW